MLNIEKYREELIRSMDICRLESAYRNDTGKSICDKNKFECGDCEKEIFKWLLSECKEPILDEVEKKYLSEVIRPFRKHVTGIKKYFTLAFQIIVYIDEGKRSITLPAFALDSDMYKGMTPNKMYSLGELGL